MIPQNKHSQDTASIIKLFGTQLKSKRQELSVSRKHLCQQAKISYKLLSELENGRIENVTIYIIIAVSNSLEFYEWDLFSIKRL